MEKGPAINRVKLELRVQDNCTGWAGRNTATTAGALTLDCELPGGWGRKQARVNPLRCNICGACLSACPRESLILDGPL